MQNSGKHNDGKCQRDFICKEISCNKLPTKKHVIFCCEHRQNNENQEPSKKQMKVEQLHSSLLVRNFKIFEEVENAGSEISYKCDKA